MKPGHGQAKALAALPRLTVLLLTAWALAALPTAGGASQPGGSPPPEPGDKPGKPDEPHD